MWDIFFSWCVSQFFHKALRLRDQAQHASKQGRARVYADGNAACAVGQNNISVLPCARGHAFHLKQQLVCYVDISFQKQPMNLIA
jgi:hypothetical protein